MRDILIVAALVLVSVPLARRVARAEQDPRLARLLLVALVVKMLASLVRYFVAFKVYGGAADASQYHVAGMELARSFRAGDFDIDLNGPVIGTGFLKILTGVLYVFLGPSKIAAFLVFSWLGFWGLYFFYRAFGLACPDGDRRRYARLVFFLPSLLYWPSSIGKETWMIFTIGLAAYGASRLFARVHGGFLLLCLGLLGIGMVRPHVGLLVLPGVAVGYLLRRTGQRRSVLRMAGKAVGALVLVGGCVVAVGQAQKFLKIESLDSSAIEETREAVGDRTEQGGSFYQAKPVRTPLDLPMATVTVLFRPFPNEAHNAQAKVASLEGLLLLALFVTSWRRLLRAPKMLLRNSYFTFASIYALLFVYAFSGFANFGVLTRQRVQVYPFALMLIALAAPPRRRVRRGGQGAAVPATGGEPSLTRAGPL